MTDVTNYETPAEMRERLAKAVKSFNGTDEEARKLGDQVLLAMGWRQEDHIHRMAGEPLKCWYKPGRSSHILFPPNPLRNAQDALDLLPEDGWEWTLMDFPEGKARASGNYQGVERTGLAHTIQAAITAAALRAGG